MKKDIMTKIARLSNVTELKSEKVELGLGDELKADLKQISDFLKKSNTADAKIQKLAQQLKDAYSQFALNKNYAKTKKKAIDSKYSKYEKLAKELGIKMAGTEFDKMANVAYDELDQINDNLMNMEDSIKSIK